MMTSITQNPNWENTNKDINNKLSIAKKILVACKKERNGMSLKNDNIISRVAFYTNAQPYLVYQVRSQMKPERTFKSWMLDQEFNIKTVISYNAFRNVILHSYIKKREIPTKDTVTKIFKYAYQDKPLKDLVRDMKLAGFIWVPIPGTKRSMIVENPEQICKRQRYLQQMKQYREEGRNIVYIEVRNIRCAVSLLCETNLDNQGEFAFMVATGDAFEVLFFYTVANEEFLEQFIIESVFPLFPKSSVLVLAEKSDHNKANEAPKETSFKVEMINWLSKNHIPHDPLAHRAELFTLIETYKQKCVNECYNIDGIIKRHGYEVLRRPRNMPMLNIFNNYFTTLVDRWKTVPWKLSEIKTDMVNFKNLYTNLDSMWKSFGTDLVGTEKKMYEEDLQMEVIFDQLMTMAKYEGISNELVLDSCVTDDHLLHDVIDI